MLKAIVSGDRARIFTNLLDHAQVELFQHGLPPISIMDEKFHRILEVLRGSQITYEITLSREN